MYTYKLRQDGCIVRSDGAVVSLPASEECGYTYDKWLSEGNTPLPADPTPPLDIRSEILSLSQKALSSGFLHIMMLDMMQRYLLQAQAIVPTVTEADLINPQSPYYSKPYADTKTYYDQLLALQDLK